MLSKCFKIVVMCTDQREFGRVCCCGWQRARGFLLFTLTCQWLGLELYALVKGHPHSRFCVPLHVACSQFLWLSNMLTHDLIFEENPPPPLREPAATAPLGTPVVVDNGLTGVP